MQKLLNELKVPAMYALGSILLLSLYHYWQDNHARPLPSAKQSAGLSTHVDANGHLVMSKAKEHAKHPTFAFESDKIRLTLDLVGGGLVGGNLLDYSKSLTDKSPVSVLTDAKDNFHVIEFGVVGDYNVRYHVVSKGDTLKSGDDSLKVKLQGKDAKGLLITKEITVYKGRHDLDIATTVDNVTSSQWVGNFYQQIRRSEPESSQGIGRRTYHGMSFYQENKPYTKLDYSDMRKRDLNTNIKGGWIAGQMHYFLSALIAPKGMKQNYFSSTQDNDNRYILGMFSPSVTLEPGESTTYSTKMYIGPEDVEALDKLSPGLGKTIDYGLLWFLSEGLMWLLRKIQFVVGNWGVSIILVTFVVKLMFYSYSNKSFKSMAKMSLLAPKIKEIQEKYKDDKAKLQQEIMAFYTKEKINPISGCLPMLVQLPFFIALYWMLIESVELRQAPFFLWIQDLSVKDPYYVLPIIMGASMLMQQLSSSSSSQDPTQKQMMLMVPIIFTFVFMNFPAGLVLYMLTNNLLSMAQQSWVKYQISK